VRQQYYRLRGSIIGPLQGAEVNAVFFELDPIRLIAPPTLIEKMTNAGGDRMWVGDQADLIDMTNRAHGDVRLLPTLTMSDGMEGQMVMVDYRVVGPVSNAPMPIGIWLNVWPRVHSKGMGLTAFYTHSELIRRPIYSADKRRIGTDVFVVTNVAFGARTDVPAAASVLLLSGKTNSQGKILAALISASARSKK
jgi:hypothetical protein